MCVVVSVSVCQLGAPSPTKSSAPQVIKLGSPRDVPVVFVNKPRQWSLDDLWVLMPLLASCDTLSVE